ncbi:MAG: alpha/beta fold hydrolase [bacterium]|jgi:predicted esterase
MAVLARVLIVHLAHLAVLLSASVGRVAAASPFPGPPPDRGDLAFGYQSLERLVDSLPKDPVIRERANRCFDGLTRDFFIGQFDAALAEIARLHGELRRFNEVGQEEYQFLFGHRYVMQPRTAVVGEPLAITLESLELERMQLGFPPVSMIAVADGVRHEVPYADIVEFKLPPVKREGNIVFFAKFKLIGEIEVARVAVLDRGIEAIREAFAARIAAAAAKGAINQAEESSLRARIALLSEEIDRTKLTALIADLPRIKHEVDAALRRAESGARPFAVPGDSWRMYRVLGTELPVRQFVPEGKGPFPLVIAFHGAGADENMFFDGYGGGALLRSASGEAFIAVCPPTVAFGVSPNLLEAFIEELCKELPIDRRRIGLMGHSLGGVTASRLAVLKADAITGAVCIAGFADLPRSGIPAPRLVLLAELDPIFPLETTRQTIEAARMRGESIELETIQHEGHTLVVGRVVPQAVRWLLSRPARISDTTKPAVSAPRTTPMNTGGPKPSENVASPSSGPRK